MTPQNFWKKYEFAENQTLLFSGGFVEVFVKRILNGWLIKSRIPDHPASELQVEEFDRFDNDADVFHFRTGKSPFLYPSAKS